MASKPFENEINLGKQLWASVCNPVPIPTVPVPNSIYCCGSSPEAFGWGSSEVCTLLALAQNTMCLISSQVYLRSGLTVQIRRQVNVLAHIVLFWPGAKISNPPWWKSASCEASLSTTCGCTLDHETRGSGAWDCHKS